MTVATVKTVATRFLTSETHEVLALKGAWGVGKTFTWKHLVEQHKKEIKLANYCYVSLFGISSIQELRTTIFTKTQSVSLLGQKLDAKTINNQWGGILLEQGKKLLQRSSKIIKELPYGNNISVALESLAPHLIRNTIICLDDFERLTPDGIEFDELLGFISELKEEKNCKVILIFNEDELKDKGTYKKYREKVIDIELLYAPTPEEAAELALPSCLPYCETVKKYAVSLVITNIRILQKIVNLVNMIYNKVKTLHAGVMEQAIMTLVLLVWCYYDSNDKKPTMDFIIEWNRMVWGFSEQEEIKVDQNRAAWAKILQEYGLTHMDEFDQTIYKVIEQGYLEETRFYEEAIKLDSQIRANELEESYSAAWKLFRNTFSDNQSIFIQALTESFKKSVQHLSPRNLDETIGLLRQLGQDDVANELIDFYIGTRSNKYELFNLSEQDFYNVKDIVILERFNRKYVESRQTLPLNDVVKYIAANNGWSDKHIDALNLATEDDFYNLFKLEHGDDLHRIVRGCLQFETLGYGYNVIGQKARAALVRIGKENKLNAIRVRLYGIMIEDLDDTSNTTAVG